MRKAFNGIVTTCVVVWIEIEIHSGRLQAQGVTTCVVVWIEITDGSWKFRMDWSPPAWWCGLKLNPYKVLLQVCAVTTCVVVWIEILDEDNKKQYGQSHHLRGGVD